MEKNIAVIKGDGIGPEITQAVVDIIDSSKDEFWYVMPKLNRAMEYFLLLL